MSQFILKGLRVGFRGEEIHPPPPTRHGIRDAPDELPDARFTIRSSDVPPEIFRDDDVGCELRPGHRNLASDLLEDFFASLIGDDGVALLPLDGGIDIFAGFREASLHRESGRAGSSPAECDGGSVNLSGFAVSVSICFCESVPVRVGKRRDGGVCFRLGNGGNQVGLVIVGLFFQCGFSPNVIIAKLLSVIERD